MQDNQQHTGEINIPEYIPEISLFFILLTI